MFGRFILLIVVNRINMTRPQVESAEGFQITNKLIELSDATFQGDDGFKDKFVEVRKLSTEETGLYLISK